MILFKGRQSDDTGDAERYNAPRELLSSQVLCSVLYLVFHQCNDGVIQV